MQEEYLIVTRHKELVKFLKERFNFLENAKILEHLSDTKVVEGKIVYGVLPLHIASKCDKIVTVDLEIPFEKRGKELTYEEIGEYYRGTRTYRVTELPQSDTDKV